MLKAPAVSHIRGEVYEVDASTLARLDELEGHPHEYRREVIQVVLDDDSLLKAWIYFYPEPYGFPEVSGDYALCVENTE